MKISNAAFFLLCSLMLLSSCSFKTRTSSSEDETAAKVKELLSRMTLEEKVGQMTQVTLDVLTFGPDHLSSYEPVVLDTAMLRKAFGKYFIGSVLNTPNNRARDPREWNRLIGQIQDAAMKYSPNRIPVIYGLDMIHGASYVAGATFFPQQSGLAATWNTELARTAGEITAYETRSTGASWIFSPVMDLGVDPRWPRFWETFGEDPTLVSMMGKSLIIGLQGEKNQTDEFNRVGCCLKHFAGYSQPRTGKDRTPAMIPDHQFTEYHLTPFKAAIEAGAMTVMINSGAVNGLPAHANKHLITDVLKKELGFKGFAVTDWQDIEFLYTRHKVAASYKEAVKMAINAGIDMSMVPYNFDFATTLIELVKEGEVPVSRIDDAVSRILTVKYNMGLFGKPSATADSYTEFGSEQFSAQARQVAEESVTLLKNQDKILPLSKNAKILVAGPAANSMRPLNGGWSYSWQGDLSDEFASDKHTIYEALQRMAEDSLHIMLSEVLKYDKKGDYRNEINGNPAEFLIAARKADYIVLCLGENSYTETPGNLNDLALSENQQQLTRLAASTGKPVILLLVQGRPRIISAIEPLAAAILQAYLPGNYGGDAIASILYGDVNPSGRLPFTYPRYQNSLEQYYHAYTEQLDDPSSPNKSAFFPQWEFGSGLSYSTFEYSNLILSSNKYRAADTLKGSVKVMNLSDRPGMEVIQLYCSDLVASLTPPVKRLRWFTKIMLQPGESQTVAFEIPVSSLAFVNNDNAWVVEQGDFTLSTNNLRAEFKVLNTRVIATP